jgi:hypothetical protein
MFKGVKILAFFYRGKEKSKDKAARPFLNFVKKDF